MVFSRFFSRDKSNDPVDFSGLGTDMHSHLIPGIDDGVMTIAESINLIKELSGMGFERIITTPHIQYEYYRNTPEIILEGLEKVKNRLAEEDYDISLEAAAEYRIDEGFGDHVKAGNLMTFGDNYILVELSYYNPHPDFENIIFNLQVDGYKVILAHPERYSYWHESWDKFIALKERGVYFQLNAVSLAGHYNDSVIKYARKFVDEGMIEFVGSDLHDENYLLSLKKAGNDKSFRKLLESGRLLNNKL